MPVRARRGPRPHRASPPGDRIAEGDGRRAACRRGQHRPRPGPGEPRSTLSEPRLARRPGRVRHAQPPSPLLRGAAPVQHRRARPPDRRRRDRGDRRAPRVPSHRAGRRRRHPGRRPPRPIAVIGGIDRDQRLVTELGDHAGDGGSGRWWPPARGSVIRADRRSPRDRGRRAVHRPEPTTAPVANVSAPQPSSRARGDARPRAPCSTTGRWSPATRPRPSRTAGPRPEYKVKSGDTLSTIAQQLRRLDDDAVVGEQAQEEDDLHVGQVLRSRRSRAWCSRSTTPTRSTRSRSGTT